jgi:hypothetical protein
MAVSKKPTGGSSSSLKRDKPIDALAAAVMAHFGISNYETATSTTSTSW